MHEGESMLACLIQWVFKKNGQSSPLSSLE
jgi:hypothetical protein